MNELSQLRLNPDAVMERFVETSTSLLSSDGATIELLDGSTLVCRAASRTFHSQVGLQSVIGLRLSEQCVREGRFIHSEDTLLDQRMNPPIVLQTDVRSVQVVPIHFGQQIVGVFKILWKHPTFFQSELATAQSILARVLSVNLTQAEAFEQKLQHFELTEKRFQSALSSSGMGIWEWDLSNNALYWSPETELILGYEIGTPVREFQDFNRRLHPEDRETVLSKVQLAIKNGSLYQHEFRLCLPDGSIRWVINTGRAEYDFQGRERLMRGTIFDITDQKTERDRIALEQSRFRTVLSTLPLGVMVADLDGKVTLLNRSLQKMWCGMKSLERFSDYSQFKAWNLKTGKLLGPMDWPLSQAIQSGLPQTGIEVRFQKFDGTYGIMRTYASPIFDGNQKVAGAIAISEEITRQKEQEDQLKISDELFRQLAGSLKNHGVYFYDLNSLRLSYVSPSFEALWEQPAETLYRNPGLVLANIHADDRPSVTDAFEKRRAGESRPIEYRIIRNDGNIRWIRDISYPIQNSDGKLIRTTGIAEDITDRRLAEQLLQESEAKFRTISNALPQMVWSALPNGDHDYFNHRWYEFTGVPVGSTDGEAWNELFHPDDQARTWETWRKSLRTGEPYEIEYRLKHHSGSYRWTLGRALPIRDNEGRITRWMGTCTDIEDLREASVKLAKSVAELEQERELREKFMTALTHDLRNPLMAAKMSAQLLQRKPSELDLAKKMSDRIVSNLERADNMIRDLLDTSRLKAGEGIVVTPTSSDMTAWVKPVVDQFADLHGERFRLHHPDAQVFGNWDGASIQRAMENLLGNAVKYGEPNTPISVRIVEKSGQVSVSVHNFGAPISQQDQAAIFRPFRRTESARLGQQLGWGVGLTIVHGIAEAHGGKIHVESDATRGTTFILTLPI